MAPVPGLSPASESGQESVLLSAPELELELELEKFPGRRSAQEMFPESMKAQASESEQALSEWMSRPELELESVKISGSG